MELAWHILEYALLVLLGLLGLITLVLVTPLRLRLEGGRETGLGWARGYAGVSLRLLGVGGVLREDASRYAVYLLGIPVWRRPVPFEKMFSGKGKKGAEPEAKEKKRKEAPKKDKERVPFTLFDFIHLLQTPNVRVVIGRLFGLLNPHGEIRGQVGFDDPSDTGYLAAVLGFVRMVWPGVGQEIRLNFAQAELKGRFELGMTIWIPQIIVGAIVIALSRDGRQLIAHLWGLRKQRLARVAQR